jgi:hypothetical protein
VTLYYISAIRITGRLEIQMTPKTFQSKLLPINFELAIMILRDITERTIVRGRGRLYVLQHCPPVYGKIIKYTVSLVLLGLKAHKESKCAF